ncbi:high-affinity nitrate transporter-activating protein 2.1 [Oryza brachyantha]|uniref:High-affinity nitrate transporter n=1 Tax=Oryza brachyantha TaxID=4533 RepID=J3LEE9_ORYBR|nr:high-affinity nitrate transporter-activating protein 2.1 [Oryza brachyantha]
MARLGVALSLSSLVLVVLLGAGLPRPAAAAATQVFLSKLPKALVVAASAKHGEVLHAGENTVTVTWSLNSTEPAGADAAFKSVKVKLCYAPASRKDRGWRKASDDLHKDKACQFKVTALPYAAGGGGGRFDYVVARDVPTASYFVRAYAVDASGTEVAYGQTSPDAAFDVAGITGIHASLKVAAGVFSTFSIAALAFFFVVEKRKKDK